MLLETKKAHREVSPCSNWESGDVLLSHGGEERLSQTIANAQWHSISDERVERCDTMGVSAMLRMTAM